MKLDHSTRICGEIENKTQAKHYRMLISVASEATKDSTPQAMKPKQKQTNEITSKLKTSALQSSH